MKNWLNSFTMQIAISTALMAVCLTNVILKTDTNLQWEKTIIASIFAYWTTPPKQDR